MKLRIVIVSGACGAGKSSVAHLLAKNSSSNQAAHMHTDDFYQYICKGFIEPWLAESNTQNETVTDVIASSAKRFYEGGYEVYVDGVVGPWFLSPWIKLANEGIDVRYIVLRPDKETTLSRALAREKELSEEAVINVWQSFSDLGKYEKNVFDTTAQTLEESVKALQDRLHKHGFSVLV